jgi:hypothetical protein
MIRELIERFAPDARKVLGDFPGVFEVHIDSEDPREAVGGLLTAPPIAFVHEWIYPIGAERLPGDMDERQFLAVIHNDGVVLVELGEQGQEIVA